MNRKRRRAAARHEKSSEKLVSIDEAFTIAIRLHQNGHLDEADRIYQQVLELNPEHPDALHFHGILCHQRGRSDEAVSLIRRAISVNPNHPDFHNNLGNVLKAMGKSGQAAESYHACLKLDPNNANALCNLGAVLRNEERYEEALRSLERAIELAPEHSEAYHNLGNVLRKLGRYEEAIAAYRESIRLIEPEESASHIATVYKSLGRMLYREHRTDEAIAVYEQWLSFDPHNPTARHLLAACSGDQVPERASDAFVTETFDIFAGSFDEVLKRLEYRAPELIYSALQAQFNKPDNQLNILDAGCGTGLLGNLIRDYAAHLVGVDLSPGMIDKAKEKSLYNELEVAELTEFMMNRPVAFDLVASADTLCYFGDLTHVFRAAFATLKKNGLFIFTLEKANEADAEEPFRLNPHGRYSHTRAYIDRALQEAQLQLLCAAADTLRNEGGEPVEGYVVTAIKA